MMKVVSIATFAAGRMTDHKSLVPSCAKSYTGIGTCEGEIFLTRKNRVATDSLASATGDLNSLAESTFFSLSARSFVRVIYIFYVPLRGEAPPIHFLTRIYH